MRATSKTRASSQISIIKRSSDTRSHANTSRLSRMESGCQDKGRDWKNISLNEIDSRRDKTLSFQTFISFSLKGDLVGEIFHFNAISAIAKNAGAWKY